MTKYGNHGGVCIKLVANIVKEKTMLGTRTFAFSQHVLKHFPWRQKRAKGMKGKKSKTFEEIYITSAFFFFVFHKVIFSSWQVFPTFHKNILKQFTSELELATITTIYKYNNIYKYVQY